MLVVLSVVAAIAITGAITAPSGSAAPRYDADVDATIADIQAYWATTMPEVYRGGVQPIPSDRLFPYSQSNPPPACGGRGTHAVLGGGRQRVLLLARATSSRGTSRSSCPSCVERFGNFAPRSGARARVGPRGPGTRRLQHVPDRLHGAAGRLLRRCVGRARRQGRRERRDEQSTTSTPRSPVCLQLRDPSASTAARTARTATASTGSARSRTGTRVARRRAPTYENDPPIVTESGYTS